MPTSPVMTFLRFGRAHHLRIRTARDLELALGLDEAHWVATSAPVRTINSDGVFLGLLDADGNGRLMCRELKDGVRWLLETLRDRRGIDERASSLRIDAVNPDTGAGQRIRLSAGKVLRRFGLPDGQEVSLELVRQAKAQAEATPVSEAGVVLPEAAGDARTRQFVTDVIAAVGGAPHPSGRGGVGQEQLDRFLAAAEKAVAWHRRGQLPQGAERTDVMPLGERTGAAWEVLSALRAKLDQYFAQCEALALDERFAARMGWTDEELTELDFDDPAAIEKVLAGTPLARGRADRELHFEQGVNPYYAGLLGRFRREVSTPVLGRDAPVLTGGQWQEIKGFFAAHQAYLAERPDAPIEALGVERLRACLDEPCADAVRSLIADSARTAFDLDNLRLLEKLLLYQAHMIDLANNFVSFPHLYDPASRAVFEMGSLVMDGRWFHLSVLVEDRKQHAAIARTSNMCLLYVQVTPRDGAKKYEVAVPVTSGGMGNLCVQKRGIFHDPGGCECDAVVVEIVENPISLLEAIVLPFKRLGRLVTGKIESLTAAAEKKLDQTTGAALDQVTTGAPAAAQAAPAKAPSGSTGGAVMGFGVAGAALASAFAYVAKTVSDNPLTIVAGIAMALLLVMLPTSLVAWLKLRKRDLSAILEGSGWAINARMRLTRRQSRRFTRRPWYPRGSRGVSRIPWRGLLTAAVLIALVLGAGEGVRRWRNWKKRQPPATRPAAAQPAERTP